MQVLSGCMALIEEKGEIIARPASIIVDGSRIADVVPGEVRVEGARHIDMTGYILTPGFINGHHHSHEGFYKGRTDNLPLELWMNMVRPVKPLPLTARDVYVRTMIGAIDAVRSGTTTLCDDLNVSPEIRPDHVEAAFRAYRDIGLRAYVGITLFDKPFFRAVPFVDEEFSPELLAELDGARMYSREDLLGFARKLAQNFHPESNRVAFMAAPSAPQRCTEDFLKEVRALADEFDLPLMIHVHETRMQAVTGQLWYGSTMIEYLNRIGFLKPKTQLIHAVWLRPSDIDILAETGASVQHNPTSNLKLGSGLAPVRAMLDGGVNISLGTDGCGSIDVNDMQMAVQLTGLLHKLRGPHQSWVGAKEALHAATKGGAKALGRERDLGAIEKGKIADLVGYRMKGTAFTPLNDAVHQLVFAATKADVAFAMVDGEVIMQDGRFTKIDEDAILTEIGEAHAKLLPSIEASYQDTLRLRDAYERIYERCRHLPIPGDTYAARFD